MSRPYLPGSVFSADEALHTQEQARPAWSIVSTMYRSRGFLERFLGECLKALGEMDAHDFEIVLVNDGSPDDSLAYAVSRQRDIPQLVVVDLSRNFGHHHAMQAGLRVARGERIFLIDCDLEVAPATLVDFAAKQQETGADLVFGYQEVRKGGWFERMSGGVFWKGFNLLSDTKIPENILTERVMTRRFVDALLSLGDHNVFLGGMMSWTGFQQIGLPIPKKQRHGQSTYTLLKRLQLMVNAVSSFSSRPLTWMFNVGVALTVGSFGYVLFLIMRKLIYGDALIGFTSLMAMVAMTLGVLTTGLGLIGIYLGKVFNQVQGRPNYIIRDIHRATARPMSRPARVREADRMGASE
jgi:putative glycosyltransferase